MIDSSGVNLNSGPDPFAEKTGRLVRQHEIWQNHAGASADSAGSNRPPGSPPTEDQVDLSPSATEQLNEATCAGTAPESARETTTQEEIAGAVAKLVPVLESLLGEGIDIADIRALLASAVPQHTDASEAGDQARSPEDTSANPLPDEKPSLPRLKELLRVFVKDGVLDSQAFSELRDLLKSVLAELPESPTNGLPDGGPQVVEESLGAGEANAVAYGTGKAIAKTGENSKGSASAQSIGSGNATAIVGAGADGNSVAATATEGDARAEAGNDSSGSVSATSTGKGDATAVTGTQSSGEANATSYGNGSASAVVGDQAAGNATSTSKHSGNADARTGQAAQGNAIATSERSGNARAVTGARSSGTALATSKVGNAVSETGEASTGSTRAVSYQAGDVVAKTGDRSSGLAQAHSFGTGDAMASTGDDSSGDAFAESSGEGEATAVVADNSSGIALAKSHGRGDAVAETGSDSRGDARAEAAASGTATAGTGDQSKGTAVATSSGSGHATAITGDRSSGNATALAGDGGGSAVALVTNEARGDVVADANGRGDVIATVGGKGSLTAISESAGGLMVIHVGKRGLVAANNSDRDIAITNLSDKAVKIDVARSGLVEISVQGSGTRTFTGNSFTITEDGEIIERSVLKPVPEVGPGLTGLNLASGAGSAPEDQPPLILNSDDPLSPLPRPSNQLRRSSDDTNAGPPESATTQTDRVTLRNETESDVTGGKAGDANPSQADGPVEFVDAAGNIFRTERHRETGPARLNLTA